MRNHSSNFTLITGANSGIGLELARQAATDGRNLVLVARNALTLDAVAEELRRIAPRQGMEGAPDVWLEISPRFIEGLQDIAVGQEIIVITWLHKAKRNTLKVHPRGDESSPLAGVFSTRSPDRPNPLGLHRVTVRKSFATVSGSDRWRR